MTNQPAVKAHLFDAVEEIPNNPVLPLLVYEAVLDLDDPDAAGRCIERFAKHGWHGAWRNGVFPFPHYHSNVHEVLGICEGQATLRLGGSSGLVMTVKAGDALVLPAGTGHQNLGSSSDFLVVGAYPNGMDWDLCHGQPEDRQTEIHQIDAVPLPDGDPLFGRDGPLTRFWNCTG